MSANLALNTLGDTVGTLPASTVRSFGAGLNGDIYTPNHPDYEARRAIWNAMITHKPALIVRCADANDVIAAVNFAREHNLLTSIRGGGHNIAGSALCHGGMTIDLSAMKTIRVDPKAHTAHVQAGALLSDLDKATQAHGLATPVGINSTTGVAGLTVGGGFGWLSRSLGLTVDNLLSADIVTSDGKLLHASAKENADLFWAVRGGGGNFGVVTSFEFRLHPIGPELYAGLIVHRFEDARDVFSAYRKVAAALPDQASCWSVLRKAPPLPFLSEDVHGTKVMVLAMCYAGDPKDGEKVFAPIRAIGKPVGEHAGPMPFVAWQAAFDPLLESGARNYWKSHNLVELSDGAIDTLLDQVSRLPSDESEVFIAQLGGAINRIDPAATAYPHRDANFVVNVHTRWRDATDDKRCIDWARELYRAVTPFSTGGVYVNFMPEDEADREKGPYGANEKRLAEIKRKYDPHNFFRVNQNIRPSA
jgi:FAD/FMN-containing dehydrogenase